MPGQATEYSGIERLHPEISKLSQKPLETNTSNRPNLGNAFHFCHTLTIKKTELEIKLFLLYLTRCTQNMPLLQIQI